MQAAASQFVGTHDFAAVRSVGTDVKSTVRTVYYYNVERRGNIIELKVCANGFLYNMARAMAGTVVYAAEGKIAPEQTLVAHDELDLAAGTARLKFDGGHGGQNGLRDIIRLLGHGKFHRLRVGIGHPGSKERVVGWVLSRPGTDEQILQDRAIDAAIDVLPLALADDFNEAMKRLHTSKP